MSLPVSPLAPAGLPPLPAVAGVTMATAAAGVRYRGRTDVLLMRFSPGTTVAGALTRSKCPSAPVDWCRAQLGRGSAIALVVNSGNANAFTGKAGAWAARTTAHAAAELVDGVPEDVYLASTGVIGEPLPAERIVAVLPDLVERLSPDGWPEAARAIMTTDTFPKAASRTLTIAGQTVTLTGIAKGSGMIQPDMATMLSFVATDAAVPAATLQAALTRAVDRSFNCVTVDGDTSTSDTVLAFATGQSGAVVDHPEALADFGAALEDLLVELAKLVVRDGEGARKFVTIRVTSAEDEAAARKIGLSIANSPLVKTAIAGADANWGRIVMAVGKSGEQADRDRLAIRLGGRPVAEDGMVRSDHDEAAATAHFKGEDILIEVDVGIANGSATVWTCDLTHGYIDINADYRS